VPGIFISIYRYDVPGIHGMNFLLPNVLGGGGVASLRSDPQVIIILTLYQCESRSTIKLILIN
jgi:hypothetical protein